MPFLRHPALMAAIVAFAPLPLAAKFSTWAVANEPAFRAEPIEVLGPFALFNPSANRGRRVLLRGLAGEDCRRFARETAERPPRAADWSQARGSITGELRDQVQRVQGKELVAASLAGRPEPEIIVVLYGSHNDGESWRMVQNFTPTYGRLQQVYPGQMETVFFGVREKADELRQIAVDSAMPWLVAGYRDEEGMRRIGSYAPADGILMLALSRDGSPLLSARADSIESIKRFIDDLTDLFRQLDPANPSTRRDRLHYLDEVRPGQFARERAGPVLVGNPLRADGLRQRGVTQVQARLEVGADGHATTVTVAPTGGVTAVLAASLADALHKGALFSPAIDHGQPVAAGYDYVFPVSAEDPATPAELAWLRGVARIEVDLNEWLVLRPIPVPPAAFSSFDHVEANGTAVYTRLEVGTEKISHRSQLNAFNTDWFKDTGAGQVAPVEGERQKVDGLELTWQKVVAHDGFVDLLQAAGNDYCVGYAWTEIDIPQALTGWLGIGSDDGLKIWLNGELVHDRWVRRNSRIDDDIVPLNLRAGRNRLLIKIQNATGDWSFVSRLRLRAAK